MSSPNGIPNPLPYQSTWGQYNNIIFAVLQAISKIQTATLVRVEACTNSGGLSPVGLVDITPLVNQLDGEGNPIPHVTIYNVPYLRIQGGANAVILDPQPGDLGLAVFASRDISKIKSTKAQGNPGSLRQYDFSDALYVGGMLNGVPQQYVQFSSSGIKILSPDTITLEAPNIVIKGTLAQSDGNVTIAQKLTVTEDVLGGTSSISLVHHTHTSASPGSPTSEPLP
jgi:hypothetical protein